MKPRTDHDIAQCSFEEFVTFLFARNVPSAAEKRDVGAVMMWLWEGLPDDIVAALAAITLVWVIETRKPTASVAGLTALYLYSGGLNAWRILRHGWHETPRTSDYIGILTQAIIPALACLLVGVWWTRRSAAPAVIAT